MRLTVLLVGLLVLSFSTFAGASMDGADVSFVSPEGELTPGTTYEFRFLVSRDASDSEGVEAVWLHFPPELVVDCQTQGYELINLQRPDFHIGCWPVPWRAMWDDSDSFGGGIHPGESTQIWIDVYGLSSMVPGAVGEIEWELYGSDGGHKWGLVEYNTAVEPRSWGIIKALYRQ